MTIDQIKKDVDEAVGIAVYFENTVSNGGNSVFVGYESGGINSNLIIGNDERPLVFYLRVDNLLPNIGLRLNIDDASICMDVGFTSASLTAGKDNREFITNAGLEKIAVGGRTGTKNGNTTNYEFAQGYINPLNTAMVIIGMLYGSAPVAVLAY